ncbi:hypothetical protein ICC18_26975 [Paenibacillus sp. WST5]|uniref:Uncharacterized protein n=1 Tax=Paenibacillus sedimenti TaxID=2770274 RepID=A0A926QLB3_9BACL|nr:hypothetical protein [Paenibacillus sedimenti]
MFVELTDLHDKGCRYHRQPLQLTKQNSGTREQIAGGNCSCFYTNAVYQVT